MYYYIGSARNHIKKEIAHNFGYHNVDYIEQINDIFMPTPRIGRRYIKWFKEPEYVEEGIKTSIVLSIHFIPI